MENMNLLQQLQGKWETRDGGSYMTLSITGLDVANKEGEERGIAWNDFEDTWVIKGGMFVTQLILNRDGTLSTLTPGSTNVIANSFTYHRV